MQMVLQPGGTVLCAGAAGDLRRLQRLRTVPGTVRPGRAVHEGRQGGGGPQQVRRVRRVQRVLLYRCAGAVRPVLHRGRDVRLSQEGQDVLRRIRRRCDHRRRRGHLFPGLCAAAHRKAPRRGHQGGHRLLRLRHVGAGAGDLPAGGSGAVRHQGSGAPPGEHRRG